MVVSGILSLLITLLVHLPYIKKLIIKTHYKLFGKTKFAHY